MKYFSKIVTHNYFSHSKIGHLRRGGYSVLKAEKKSNLKSRPSNGYNNEYFRWLF